MDGQNLLTDNCPMNSFRWVSASFLYSFQWVRIGTLDLMTIPASDASLAACTGFSGLLFPGTTSIGSLFPIAFVMLSSSLPFVGGLGSLGFLGARCRPTQDTLTDEVECRDGQLPCY